MWLRHWVRRAASRAACTAGKSNATKTPMMAMTTSNSTSVKPVRPRRDSEVILMDCPHKGEEKGGEGEYPSVASRAGCFKPLAWLRSHHHANRVRSQEPEVRGQRSQN